MNFTATSNGTFFVGQTSAPVDSVLILYLGSFDPTSPGQNAVIGNDDTVENHAAVGATVIGCGGLRYCPQVSYDLTTGQQVVIVASTYRAGQPFGLPVSFYTVLQAPSVVDITADHNSADIAAGTVLPVFRGGTLRLAGDGITHDFTVDADGGTIDQNGVVSTFTGSFSNDGVAVPGRLVIINGGAGGRVVLAGVNSFTGGFTVNSGATLEVNGNSAAASDISVLDGGTLSGTGTAPTVTVGNGGTLAPGNSIGTMTVSGALNLAAGSRFVVEYAPGSADRVNVMAGTSLAGALIVVPVDGVAPIGTIHRIIASGGNVSGSFTGVEAPSTGIAPNSRFDVIYGVNSADLAVTPERYAAVGLSRNQIAAGQALDGVRPTAGLRLSGPTAALFDSLYPLSEPQAAQALTELSGEVATGASAIGYLAGGQFLAAMLDPLAIAQPGAMGVRLAPGDGAARRDYSVWGTPFGAYNRTDGNSTDGSARRSVQGAGFALGLDMRHGADTVLGLAVAAGEGQASLSGGRGTSRADYGQAGVYLNTRLGAFSIAAAGAFTHMEIDTNRTLSLLGGARQEADATAQVYSFRVETRHDGVVQAGMRLMPLAAIQAQRVESHGYTEKGTASGSALAVPGQGNSSIRSEFGVHAEGAVEVAGRPVRGFLRAAWGHYFENDVTMNVALAAPESSRFTVRGARSGNDVALLSAGAETTIATGVKLGARLDGELASGMSQIAGTLLLRYEF